MGREQYAVLALDLMEPPMLFAGLTPSERAVAILCARGLSASEIARVRDVSSRTVVNQLAQVYKKLGVRSRRELTAIWHAGALVPK
jgi:DNA-binding CsgD family transcriptional regulator